MRPRANLREAAHNFRLLRTLMRTERRYHGPAPLGRRLGFWRDGFLTESAMQYGMLDLTIDRKSFVNDWQRAMRMSHLDDPYGAALDNKLLFDRLIRPLEPEMLPALHGIFTSPNRLYLDGGFGEVAAVEWIAQEVSDSTGVVVKPVDGGSGIGVRLIRRVDGELISNGKPTTVERLRLDLASQTPSIVSSFAVQHPYAAAIAPFCTNTMRILTYWDDAADEAVLGRAVHRFGRMDGDGLDNTATGGVTAAIDQGTGIMARAAQYTPGGPIWYDVHPDTGAQIAGVSIPGWTSMVARLLALHSRLAFLPWIGWDVLMCENGPILIEANRFSGVTLLQVHGALLSDHRLADFLRRHKVVNS